MMDFFIMIIEFILKLFFIFMAIEIVDGISFGLFLVSCLVVYLFIKFFISLGGNKND